MRLKTRRAAGDEQPAVSRNDPSLGMRHPSRQEHDIAGLDPELRLAEGFLLNLRSFHGRTVVGSALPSGP
jgi:hypothetical protein